MKVAEVVAQGQLGVRQQSKPVAGPGEILLRVKRVGICGSDLHYLPHAPVGGVIGHEFIGEVVGQGPDVTAPRIGQRVCTIPCIGCGHCVFCLSGDPIKCPDVRMHGGGTMHGMGGFGEYVLAGARESIVIPDHVDDTAAALIEPLAVGLHIVERAALRLGETLLILGAGPIGLACLVWARSFGIAEIVVSDPVPMRRELALKLGATQVVDPMSIEPGAFCRETFGTEPEVVLECIGRPGRLDAACRAAKRDGRVMIAGMLMQEEQYNPNEPFFKGLTVQNVVQYAMRHFIHTVSMMNQRRIDPTPMVTGQISIEELPAMMETLARPNAHCKVLVAEF